MGRLATALTLLALSGSASLQGRAMVDLWRGSASVLVGLQTPTKTKVMIRRTLVALTLALASASCVLTDVKIPLDTDLDNTQLGDKVGESTSQSVLWVAAWGDAGIQAAAKQGGITNITHADQRIFLVLFGLYATHTTVVYGN